MTREKSNYHFWMALVSVFFFTVYAVSFNVVTAAFAFDESTTGSYHASTLEASRNAVKARLLQLGYSEVDSEQAISELSEEEIYKIAKHPHLIKRVGYESSGSGMGGGAAAALVLVGLLVTSAATGGKSKSRPPVVPQPKTVTKEVEVIYDICPVCKGKGRQPDPECNGTGKSGVKDDWGNELDCKTCNGTGYLNTDCTTCDGTGRVKRK